MLYPAPGVCCGGETNNILAAVGVLQNCDLTYFWKRKMHESNNTETRTTNDADSKRKAKQRFLTSMALSCVFRRLRRMCLTARLFFL